MSGSNTALVTGAAGFLGSHIADALLDAGWRVIGVDDFSTSDPDSKHHTDLIRRKPYKFSQQSVCDQRTVLELTAGHSVSLVVNMACPASPPLYQAMPEHTLMTSVLGAQTCIAVARATAAPKCVILHASTSEVYGDPAISPQPESYWGCVSSWGPRACYDEGKRAAEALMWIAKSGGADVRVARIFNTYGPRMRLGDGRVVTEFVRAILRGEQLPLHGTGSQTRSLCYVSDTVAGLLALATLPVSPSSPVNVGSDVEVSMADLAGIILRQAGITDAAVCLKPRPVHDPARRKPDLSLMRSLTGWAPRVSLEDGLRATLAWFRARAADAAGETH